jgi:predicted Fe-Mo cluster-binding NifX family protein
MKVSIPVSEFRGLDSPVCGHFGSAPCFVLVDTETMSVEPLSNRDEHHVHGACSPLRALAGRSVDMVLVDGIGAGALHGLRRGGIPVHRAPSGTVAEAIRAFQEGRTEVLAGEPTCVGHAHGCGGER